MKNLAGNNSRPPEQQDWHPSDVIAALHRNGLTLSKIAEDNGLTNTGTLSKALRMGFPIAEKRIADALGLKPQNIWPSRFHENGERKQVGYRRIKAKQLDSAAQVA